MFELNKEYNGFTCVKKEDIKDIKSEGMVFEHTKTKARLVYIKNTDKNKVFSIGFRTPASDNTGVPHILEHSVLCGSKKYPVKEPFVELLKSSVNTFLNAMTMPDLTLYPVASTNEKDFMNLMNVYLDAVFYPNIYTNKEIFMQEGWHYDIEDKGKPLSYKGVVYNEMKGVYSNPESVLFYNGMKTLFPDSPYSFEYGGKPNDIPDLTYEEFLNFHKTYYHPSNSYIYIYGDCDAEECMKTINEDYLSNYEYKKIDSKIPLQEGFKKEVESCESYPVGEDESLEKKALMGLNFVVSNSLNLELTFAMKMLEYYLLETAASPIKKAIIEKELCSEIYGFYESALIQPYLAINLIEIDENKKDEIKDLIFEVLKKEVKNGIDEELMEATINRIEFSYRKITEGLPRGLNYNYNLLETWIYDADPLQSLYYEDIIKNIRKKYKSGYFEKIINDYILNNNHRSTVLLVPDKKIAEKREKELEKKLSDIKNSMNVKEIKDIVKSTKKLLANQTKKDSKANLATIPTLSLDDIEKTAEDIKIRKEKVDGVGVYLYEDDTNKIVYGDLTFNTSCIPIEDISYINLLANLLTELSTKKYSYEALSKKINKTAGYIGFNTEVVVNPNNSDEYLTSLVGHYEGIENNLESILDLVAEVALNTKYEEDSKIKEIISKLRLMMEQTLVQDGHVTVTKRIQSYYSQSGKYYDAISGIEFYKFLVEIDTNYDTIKEVIKGKLKSVAEKIFKKEHMYMTFVCEKDKYDNFTGELSKLVSMIPEYNQNDDITINKYNFHVRTENEGFMTQSDVQYVGMGYNFKKLGYEYSGVYQVLKQILSLDYLWNVVRVKGGAYGAKLAIGVNGDFIMSSYRDPNLKETIKNYKNTVKYLKHIKNDKDFYKYVIGTTGILDRPASPYNKAKIAEKRILRGVTYADIQRERDEVLATKPRDIKKCAKMISQIIKKNNICAIGNEKVIRADKKLFNKVLNLKQ